MKPIRNNLTKLLVMGGWATKADCLPGKIIWVKA